MKKNKVLNGKIFTLSALITSGVLLLLLMFFISSCGEEKKKEEIKYDSFSLVKIEGEIGKEPKVTVPKNFNATNEAFGLLREGNGKKITDENEVIIKVQKLDTANPEKIYSYWKDKDDISIDLQESYKKQVPADLRTLLLGARVGAVLVYSVKQSLRELTEGENKSEKKVNQIWIISVVKAIKATIITEDPNIPATKSGIKSTDSAINDKNKKQ